MVARAKNAIISFTQLTIARETAALQDKFSQREARLREQHEALIHRVDDACRSLILLDDRAEDVAGRVANLEDRVGAATDVEDSVLRRVAAVEQRCNRAEGSAGAVAARLQRALDGFRFEARAPAAPPPAGGAAGGGVSWAEFHALQEHVQAVDASVQQFSEQLCADMEAWQGSMRESLQTMLGAMSARIAALEQALSGAGEAER